MIVDRLLTLLDEWIEAEVRAFGHATMFFPDEKYIWKQDSLGHYHHGHWGRGHKFKVLEPGFVMPKVPVKRARRWSDADEFGVAFRQLEEVEQALILTDHLGSPDEWREIIEYYGISRQGSGKRACRMLRLAWEKLTNKCRARRLVQ